MLNELSKTTIILDFACVPIEGNVLLIVGREKARTLKMTMSVRRISKIICCAFNFLILVF